MANSLEDAGISLPTIQFRTPTYNAHSREANATLNEHRERSVDADPAPSQLRPEDAYAVLDGMGESSRPTSSGNDIHLGSYGPRGRSVGVLSSGTRTPVGSIQHSPHAIQSQLQLQHLLQELDMNQETYGVEEDRDGFFNPFFLDTRSMGSSKWKDNADSRLITESKGHHPLSVRYFPQQQAREVIDFVRKITSTRAGIKLAKTFIAFFIAYIICLIPSARNWLGPYNFILVLSTILNHPGRPIGAQLDGLGLTILGTIGGLGWGSLALYVSTSTAVAKSGYGGILALFLVLFTAVISFLRCTLIRFYQLVICAGIAIVYTCLADTSTSVSWRKILDYGVPWALGQAVCLLVCLSIFPDAGSRSLA